MTITAGQVKKIIENELADETRDNEAAEVIAAWCEERAGKMITEKNKPQGVYIVKHYGWTEFQTEVAFYSRMASQKDQTGPDLTMIIDRREVYAEYPQADTIREANPQYFAGVVKRNERRRELLASPESMRAIAHSLNNVNKALAAVKATLSNEVDDRYRIIEEAGLSEVKIGRLQL